MECNIFSSVKKVGISHKTIAQTVGFVLKKEKVKGDISVHLVGNARMRTLNKLHRAKDKPTDVLSFSAIEGMDMLHGQELGDIFLSPQYIKKQAADWGVSYKEEFMRMLVHGVLHVLGYDHIQEDEAKVMFGKQETYLSKCI